VGANIDGISVTVDNVLLENLRFPIGTAAHTSDINVAAANCTIRKCFILAGVREIDAITATAAAEKLTIEDCTWIVTADGPHNLILFEGVVDHPVIRNNYLVGCDGTNAVDDGILNFGGFAITNAVVVDNVFDGADVATTVMANVGSLVGDCVARNMYAGTATAADTVTTNAATIGAGAILTTSFGAGAIDAAAIANNAIDLATFAADCKTGSALKANVETITNDAITAASIVTGGFTADAFAADALVAATFATGAFTADAFAADAIVAATLATGAFTADAFAANAIVAATLAAGCITATTIATNAIDADALAADAIDEIVDEALAAHHTQNTLGGAMASVEMCCEKADGAVLLGDDALFTIAGGPIHILEIAGIVTTEVGAGATNVKLQLDTTSPSATYELNAGAVDINGDIVGTSYRSINTTGVFTPVTVGAVLMANSFATNPTEYFAPAGTIQFNSDAARAGVIAWYLRYKPLSPNSVVTAAA
jgi:hypothetical protein